MTFTQLEQKLALSLNPSEWRQQPNGGGWIHEDVFITDNIFIGKKAILIGGTFNGGTFNGGTFNGGTFEDGTFNGGTFNGGTFEDGTFNGGTFEDGKWITTPFSIHGSMHLVTLVDGCNVSIGCERHPIEFWIENYERIGRSYRYSAQQVIEYGIYLLFISKNMEMLNAQRLNGASS